jgi:hypothetical protein
MIHTPSLASHQEHTYKKLPFNSIISHTKQVNVQFLWLVVNTSLFPTSPHVRENFLLSVTFPLAIVWHWVQTFLWRLSSHNPLSASFPPSKNMQGIVFLFLPFFWLNQILLSQTSQNNYGEAMVYREDDHMGTVWPKPDVFRLKEKGSGPMFVNNYRSA